MTISGGALHNASSRPAIRTLYAGEVSGSAAGGGAAVATPGVFSAVDCTYLTRKNGYMLIDMKCDLPDNLTSNTQLEITSSSGPDFYEWYFTGAYGLGITTSYQTFRIPLWKFAESVDPLNPSSITYARWYVFIAASAPTTTIWWKNMRVHWIGPMANWGWS